VREYTEFGTGFSDGDEGNFVESAAMQSVSTTR